MKLLMRIAALFLLAAAMTPALSFSAGPSNKWRIAVNHTASVAGEVEFAFTPAGGATTRLVVPIPAGTHENKAAHLIRDAVRARFGKSLYKVELDDGEDVLVKVRGRSPDVEIMLVRNTAEGLTFHLSRE